MMNIWNPINWSCGLTIRRPLGSNDALLNATWTREAHGWVFTRPDITTKTQTGHGSLTSWEVRYFISITGRRYRRSWSSTTQLICLLRAFPRHMNLLPTNGTFGNRVPA